MQTRAGGDTILMNETRAFRDTPPTIAEIRDAIRNHAYSGDLFEALAFLLTEYDNLNSHLKFYTRPVEYITIPGTSDYTKEYTNSLVCNM